MTGEIIALTGASGFLGRRLAPALIASGRRVRVLLRDPVAHGGLGCDVVTGDLRDAKALDELCVGASAIIHAAGLIKARDRDGFMRINRDAAAALAAAARQAGVQRFLQISSLAAREPGLSNYAASKRAGEEAVLGLLGDGAMALRPPAIYGPGDRETLGLFKLAKVAPLLPVPAAPGQTALAHVDDIVAGILERLDRRWTPGVWALPGNKPQGYAWPEIFNTAAEALGRHPPLAPIPPAALQLAGSVSETFARLRGAPAIFNRGKVRELLHPDWSVRDSELAPESLAPYRPLPVGFAGTVTWYREAGWLS